MTTVEDPRTAPPVTVVEPEAGERRRWRRGLVRLALGVVLVAVGAGAWAWASKNAGGDAGGGAPRENASAGAGPAAGGPVATGTVERGTISLTERWDGTLDYGRPSTITSPAAGTVTRLPEPGQTIERGDELYRVDERPGVLLYGTVPMYRDLGPGGSGTDVEQMESNLAALGYGGFTVDEEYTSATAEAVRGWQADVGVVATGVVARGDVVFVPAGGQVDTLRTAVGAVVAPGMPVLDITGPDQAVGLEAEVDDRDWFEVDTGVTILLPGGDQVAGTVAAVAVVDAIADGGEGTPESVLRVEIAVAEPAPDEVVGASVEVVVAVDERSDVLLVPVNALLALAEGGYGLEVVAEDGSTSIIAVETGLFAGGKVEVSSAEVTEGTVVGVAGR